MSTYQLPEAFQRSCLDSESYPSNYTLRSTSTYPTALDAWKNRLDERASDLCVYDEVLAEIPIRDLHPSSGIALEKRNIHDSQILKNWLGLQTAENPQDPTQQVAFANKQDPKCRFIYIYGEHSRARLKITKDMLTLILTYHQVMPVYLDFMSVFGSQTEPRDLRFSGFREQTLINDPPRGLSIPTIGRSGRQYQLCYNLKCVALKSEDTTNPKLKEWSIRHTAVHHQFDVVYGTTLWIITKGNLDIQQRFKDLTGPRGRPEDNSFETLDQCFRSSLAAHLLYCHWSTEDWRWYIRWLETVIDEETIMAVYGRFGQGSAHEEYSPRHIQDLQRWQDKINEVIMVLESNVDVMTSLCKFYAGLKANKHFPQALKDACDEDMLAFTAQIEDMMSDFRMQIARATVLLKITNDRKELVLQHIQSQSAARMERLNINMEKEAIVVRIITLVTLIYLPATFVSTFFSTDIVKYQNPNGGPPGTGNYSSTALVRWLQVTFPLTAVTILAAYISWWSADKNRLGDQLSRHRKMPLASKSPPADKRPKESLLLRMGLKSKPVQLPMHHQPKTMAGP